MKRSMMLVLLVALVLTACGGTADEETTTSTTQPDPTTTLAETTTQAEATTTTAAPEGTEATGDLARLQAAMSDSAAAHPSRIEGVMAFTLAGGESIEMPMSMQVDPDSGDSAMSMDMGAMAAVGGGDDDIPAEMAELMGTMEVREIGETVYLRFPFFTAFLGAETEWVSMPSEDEDMADEMTGPTPDDPGGFLDAFSDVEGTVEELGTEDIRGITATHYRLTVDEDWQDHLSGEELAELEDQGPLPDASFPIDLWVSPDGLVHRMSMEMDDPTGEAEDFESMTMTFDFFDFGESVTIEAPPAGQVTDISELEGPMGTIQP